VSLQDTRLHCTALPARHHTQSQTLTPQASPTHPNPKQQVGAGGGMKGGVNVWKALRDTKDLHSAWLHIDRPYREEDLPRKINTEADEKSGRAVAAGGSGKGAPDLVADQEAFRVNGKAAHVKSNGRHKSAIQRAIEIEANTEIDELGVVAL